MKDDVRDSYSNLDLNYLIFPIFEIPESLGMIGRFKRRRLDHCLFVLFDLIRKRDRFVASKKLGKTCCLIYAFHSLSVAMRLMLIVLAAVSAIAAPTDFSKCPSRPPIARKSSSLLVESLTGKVTAKEISTFIGFVRGLAVPTTSLNNVIADGFKGMNVEAMGLMYELVGDPQLLDTMIRHTDAMLHLRNDPVHGKVMWTGKKELVWITQSKGPNAKYAGSENGDIIGHIPCLHNSIVKVGDKYGYGKTYYQRAATYVKELDKSMVTYFIPWFIDNKTLAERWPETKRFPGSSGLHNGAHIPGSPFPWNQQMMFNNAPLNFILSPTRPSKPNLFRSTGLQRLAEAHELLGNRPDKVRYYDSLVNHSVHFMIDHFLDRTAAHGQKTYLLLYSATEKYQPHQGGVSHYGELTGIHLLYDIWGLIREA
ncbi:hypothetical protein BC937DRAFT_88677 [Endogone sp. FLAS-F59071]|nr:hypothetical protein BC937DRAFT_88677 [Endogone sp. FLAS-F59071]|eukprot:RUS18513.1 hypothetical protein BC937DRAFT_88677 [Endogone sp. FLAS-F59071]